MVTVVDKVPPQVAWLNETHSHIYKRHPLLEFRSANLINEGILRVTKPFTVISRMSASLISLFIKI